MSLGVFFLHFPCRPFKISFFFVFCCLFVFSIKNLFTKCLFCVLVHFCKTFFFCFLLLHLENNFDCFFFCWAPLYILFFFCVLKNSFSFFFLWDSFWFSFSFLFLWKKKKQVLLFYSLALMYLKRCWFFQQIGENTFFFSFCFSFSSFSLLLWFFKLFVCEMIRFIFIFKFLLKFFSLVIVHHFSLWSLFLTSFCPSLGAFVTFFFSLFSPFFLAFYISMFLFFSLSRVSLSFILHRRFLRLFFLFALIFLFLSFVPDLILFFFFLYQFFLPKKSFFHEFMSVFLEPCLYLCLISCFFPACVVLLYCVFHVFSGFFAFLDVTFLDFLLSIFFLGLFKNCRVVWKNYKKISLILLFLFFQTPCFSSFCDQFFL